MTVFSFLLPVLANAADMSGTEAKNNPAVANSRSETIFRDDFNEDFLSDDWQVINPNAQGMVLDEGKLVLVTLPGDASKKTLQNMVVLKKEIPARQYEAMVKLHGDLSSSGNLYAGIMLYADENNRLTLWLKNTGSDGYGPCGNNVCNNVIKAYFTPLQNGEWSGDLGGNWIAWNGSHSQQSPNDFTVYLRLKKNKYKYTAYVSTDNKKWSKMGTIPMLGFKGDLTLFANRGNAANSMVDFDWITVK